MCQNKIGPGKYTFPHIKNRKIVQSFLNGHHQAHWYILVVSGTRKAEAGGSLDWKFKARLYNDLRPQSKRKEHEKGWRERESLFCKATHLIVGA